MVDLHRDVTWAILIPPFPGSNPGTPANECAGRRLFGDPKEMGDATGAVPRRVHLMRNAAVPHYRRLGCADDRHSRLGTAPVSLRY